jgi:AGCS family alanine or glycine:cation symporter
VGAVILGGITRIGYVTSRLVPWMATIYVLGGLLVLVFNIQQIPGVLSEIFSSAFKPAAQIGGLAGGSFIFMLTWGVKRGLFSNESGQGSAPIAHAAAKTDEPVREGVVAMVGPLIDTLIICTITGLVILSTGVWHEKKMDRRLINAQSAITVVDAGSSVASGGSVGDADLANGTFKVVNGAPTGIEFVVNHSTVGEARLLHEDGSTYGGEVTISDGAFDYDAMAEVWVDGGIVQNGSPLTAWAFERGLSPLGGWGKYIVTLGVFLFGLSTAISWSYYGDRAVVYLFGARLIRPYHVVYCIVHFLGAIFALEIVWNFGDSALALMALPNLIALLLLNGRVRALTADYFSRN